MKNSLKRNIKTSKKRINKLKHSIKQVQLKIVNYTMYDYFTTSWSEDYCKKKLQQYSGILKREQLRLNKMLAQVEKHTI